MQVRVKAGVCVGHAMCLLACPQIFQISDDGGYAYTLRSDVPADLEEAVRQAVRGCPEGAIETY